MSINALLNQTVTLTTRSGTNKYGEASFGAGVSSKARVQVENKIVKGPQGEDIGTDALIFLPGAATLEHGDKITHDGITYRAILVSKVADGGGSRHHYEVRVQRIA